MHASLFSVAAGAALLSGAVLAHPHVEHSGAELVRRAQLSRRCEPAVAAMNKKRWEKRQLQGVGVPKQKRAANSTTVNVNIEAPYYATLQNTTCVAAEEVTAGPYVWPRSQTLRQDMTENEPGIPMLLDIGVMDMATCEPLPDVLVDVWHCNATGSYSSFTGRSPNTPFEELLKELNLTIGAGDLDLHTDSTTFLRALWPTDSEGMVEFKTVVPGFYVERAIHIHSQVHTDYTIRNNGTVATGTTVSTTQFGIDEETSQKLMAVEPYVSHTQITRVPNDEDSIFSGMSAAFDSDMAIVPIDGEDILNGVVGYITIGVDTAAKRKMKRELSPSSS